MTYLNEYVLSNMKAHSNSLAAVPRVLICNAVPGLLAKGIASDVFGKAVRYQPTGLSSGCPTLSLPHYVQPTPLNKPVYA